MIFFFSLFIKIKKYPPQEIFFFEISVHFFESWTHKLQNSKVYNGPSAV